MSVLFQLLAELAAVGVLLAALVVAHRIFLFVTRTMFMVVPGVKVCSNCGCPTMRTVYCPSCHYATLADDSSR